MLNTILHPRHRMAAWNPYYPCEPEVVGPAGTQGVTHTTIQAAVDAAIIKRTNKRQYIAVMPGEYQGTVYVPAARWNYSVRYR